MTGSIDDAVQDILRSVFRRNDLIVTRQLTAKDVPGWDSFRYVSIIMAVEERFGVQFSDDDIDGFKNIGDLMDAVATKTDRGS